MTDNQYRRDPENVSYMYTGAIPSGVYSLYKPPPIVGYWVLPGSAKGYETKFAVTGKPSWLHRKTMALLLGFRWEDEA